MAAFVTEGTDALQVALAHLFFNFFGVLIWYPIPFMRRVPMHMARQLGKATRAWKGFPFLYILIAFFLFPLLLLALSTLFSSKKTSQVVAASIILVVLLVGIVALVYWWVRLGGRESTGTYFAKRQRRVNALETLPYDMTWAQRRIFEIQFHTGMSPANVVTKKKSESEDVYANVADEMDHVTKMVKALADYVGLEKEVDHEGLGRFRNKANEKMPAVDMTRKNMYKLTILGVVLVCLALYLWAVGVLFRTGSVGTRGLAGWLLVMLGLVIIWRIYARLTSDGTALSDAAYIDKELKKMHRGMYTEKMAHLNADIDKLVIETQMPPVEDEDDEKLVVPTSDEDTNNGATDEEMSK
jgi:protein-S-isoprenylcysteine O-methyltransferase Ste14